MNRDIAKTNYDRVLVRINDKETSKIIRSCLHSKTSSRLLEKRERQAFLISKSSPIILPTSSPVNNFGIENEVRNTSKVNIFLK